jgi:threonine dehydrogenase-like Zn-dependent dehydrogenase
VVGGGTMGSGIAVAGLAASGVCRVVLVDRDEATLDRAQAYVARGAQSLARRGRLRPALATPAAVRALGGGAGSTCANRPLLWETCIKSKVISRAVACKGSSVFLKKNLQKHMYMSMFNFMPLKIYICIKTPPLLECHSGPTQVAQRLTFATSFDALRDCHIVVEAVFEQLSLKQAVFAQLAQVCSSTCVLATNTSTLDVDAIASAAGAGRLGSVEAHATTHTNILFEDKEGRV